MRERALRKILFVCTENSNRSQMAEAFARIHGEGIVEAHSAGSHPSGTVNPRAIDAMAEVGYDLSTPHSKSLDEIPHDSYDVVVTMGCGDDCPLLPTTRKEDWELPDPRDMRPQEFRGVRDRIEKLTKRLVEEVAP